MHQKHATNAVAHTTAPPPGWPAPMGKAAMHGLLGDIIATIGPHTEADPAALTLQFLGAFGNVVGRHAHFRVEADHHYPNLFVALVGRSARGRKGTSWGYMMEMFRQVDKSWTKERVQPGLSTGEGLIQAIADNGLDSEAADKSIHCVRGRVQQRPAGHVSVGKYAIHDPAVRMGRSHLAGDHARITVESERFAHFNYRSHDPARFGPLLESDRHL
jgi:hypothetical protein